MEDQIKGMADGISGSAKWYVWKTRQGLVKSFASFLPATYMPSVRVTEITAVEISE